MSEQTIENGRVSDNLNLLVSKTTWYCKNSKQIEQPKEVADFLTEILGVCKKHGFSISHEDGHGAFEIEEWDEETGAWLGCAHYRVR